MYVRGDPGKIVNGREKWWGGEQRRKQYLNNRFYTVHYRVVGKADRSYIRRIPGVNKLDGRKESCIFIQGVFAPSL